MENQTIMFFAVVCTLSFVAGRYLKIRKLLLPTEMRIPQKKVDKVLDLKDEFADEFKKLRERNVILKRDADIIELETKKAWFNVRRHYKLDLEPHLSVSSNFKQLYVLKDE